MEGFEAGSRDLPTPPIAIDEQVRDRLALTVYAIAAGNTPEEIAGHLEEGFPDDVTAAMGRPGELDEMRAHVDLLLTVLQTPAPTPA